MPYDSMEPGLTTSTAFTRLPPGWSYDAPSRTISIDYSAAGGTVTVTQTGAITADMFILFGTQAGGAMVGQIGPGFFSNTIPNTADKLRARQWVGSRMGVTVS
jgi:hypothetical protein